MRANLSDTTNPNAVTKKFWSYVKNSSNSNRIPDFVFRNNIFAKNPIRQAELFNNFFYDQFSTKSSYSIDVDFSSDDFIDFKFDENKIIQILLGLDTNKSSGPDEISGMVLKNCVYSLALPLSILLNLSFSMGQLPPDRKLANVVPIYQKGGNCDVSNYRPISLTSLVMKIMEICIRDEPYERCKHLIHEKTTWFSSRKIVRHTNDTIHERFDTITKFA